MCKMIFGGEKMTTGVYIFKKKYFILFEVPKELGNNGNAIRKVLGLAESAGREKEGLNSVKEIAKVLTEKGFKKIAIVNDSIGPYFHFAFEASGTVELV